MKRYIGLAIFAIVLCILAGFASAQTASGISISDPYGYTRKSTRWVNKRVERKRRNKGEAVAEAFRQNMEDLQMFGAVVDAAWQNVVAEERGCGRDVNRLQPFRIRITIEPEPFMVGNQLAAGVDYDDGRIRIVWWHLSDVLGTQTAKNLVAGELRQLAYWWLTGRSRELWGVTNICN